MCWGGGGGYASPRFVISRHLQVAGFPCFSQDSCCPHCFKCWPHCERQSGCSSLCCCYVVNRPRVRFLHFIFDGLHSWNITLAFKKKKKNQNADFCSLCSNFCQRLIQTRPFQMWSRSRKMRRASTVTQLFWKHTIIFFFPGEMTFNRPEFLSANAIVIRPLISLILISCHCLLYLIWKSSITNLLSALLSRKLPTRTSPLKEEKKSPRENDRNIEDLLYAVKFITLLNCCKNSEITTKSYRQKYFSQSHY